MKTKTHLGMISRRRPKSPFFADEEKEAKPYSYSLAYSVKPICEQIAELSKHFKNLEIEPALARSKNLPAPPAGAEGWFAVPRWEKVAKSYGDVIEQMLDLFEKIGVFYHSSTRRGYDWAKLRQSERTKEALWLIEKKVWKKQECDFLFIPAQLSLAHRGRSVRRMHVVYAPNEFGLGAFDVGCMILSHSELISPSFFRVTCPGDEYCRGDNYHFTISVPIFYLHENTISLLTIGNDERNDFVASGFVP